MLELKNVSLRLPDQKEILRNVNLKIDDGKFVVVTGPNGGGKTTLAKVVSGIETPTAGAVFLDGCEITNMGITQRARFGICYAFQQPVRFKGITVRDLLELAAGKKLREKELCNYLMEVGLCAQNYTEREIDASLSGGEIKRIEIAAALARDARITIFDEPEAGIDLWSFNSLIDVFKGLRKKGRSVLVISHQERILAIADEIVVVAEGEIRHHGPKAEIFPMLLGEQKQIFCPQQEGRL
ncbi:ABC transporter ATP-binding protein [Christensenella tenuis]|uniref:ATP-binding cassette domain-containing protein n=1 Tax=Christensenella tenuis TaxID=2763033 RepID=A0ABR7EG93_9FIRM|nr:ATP-binding cassette domain-containing protein [Christensenella tenuis]MBC5648795.1 ATP-binding cassette domain-containing protein [Christensenella tenuis]